MIEQNYSELHIPQFTLADRLYKAMDVSGVKSPEMAEYLGVTRETVSRYRNGGSTPRLSVIRAWSMKTGVDFEWLRTGKPSPEAE